MSDQVTPAFTVKLTNQNKGDGEMKKRLFVLLLMCITVFGCTVITQAATKKSSPKYTVYVYREGVVNVKNTKTGKVVKKFWCSCGLDETPTPKGTFYLQDRFRWKLMVGNCYVQYATRISGPYYFHSVIYDQPRSDTLRCTSFNNLGMKASHGCIRLCVRDAKWIYDNCKAGTKVVIKDGKYKKNGKWYVRWKRPAALGHTYGTIDPTDPNRK